jgi:hypothetical protein
MTQTVFTDTFGVFRADCGHVPVRLRSIPSARILWLNRTAMAADPAFTRIRGDEIRYRQQLLDACAYQVVTLHAAAPTNGEAETVGLADRYGGNGIGHNGGSGRNVWVNDYFVKGAGRTPLVSRLTPLSHASGGAYLEEAVRETIYAEVVGREFPHGAVPTLAIIDTGLDQDWPEGIVPSRERRVLIVRPAFVRPAHFERAVGFISPIIKEGALDHARVRVIFATAIRGIGERELIARLFTFFQRWTHQLAYAFVHRLPHGNNTSSNIAFDGRMVDFGATSAVPSWAVTATSLMPDPFARRFDAVARAIKSLCYYFGRHVDSRLASPKKIDATIEENRAHFHRFVCLETLKLCGVSTATALEVLNTKRIEKIQETTLATIQHYQRAYIDFVDGEVFETNKHAKWDLATLWEVSPPSHLRTLSGIVRELVPADQHAEAKRHFEWQCRHRPALYAPLMREEFFGALARGERPTLVMEPETLSHWIEDRIRMAA